MKANLEQSTMNNTGRVGGLLGYLYSHLSENQFISCYGGDFMLPIMGNYLMNYVSDNIYMNSITSTLICSLFEILQKIDLWPGTYDTNDFLAYGLGGLLSFGLNYINKKIDEKEELLEDKI